MYKRDHNPPHFHIRTPDGDAAVTLDGYRTIAGTVDRRAFREATEWVERNRELAADLWTELQKD